MTEDDVEGIAADITRLDLLSSTISTNSSLCGFVAVLVPTSLGDHSSTHALHTLTCPDNLTRGTSFFFSTLLGFNLWEDVAVVGKVLSPFCNTTLPLVQCHCATRALFAIS